MKREILALLLASGVGTAFSGIAVAEPDLPKPPGVEDLPRPPDPPGPAPRPPAPGDLPKVDDDHPWWDPLGLFDDDDDRKRGRGHDKHEGRKDKHHNKHGR
jgi:hypothetical protein